MENSNGWSMLQKIFGQALEKVTIVKKKGKTGYTLIPYKDDD